MAAGSGDGYETISYPAPTSANMADDAEDFVSSMDNSELRAELPDAVLQHAAADSLTVSTQRTSYSHQTIVPATQQTFEMSYLTPEPASVELSIMELQRIAGSLPNDKWKPLGRALGLLEMDLNTTAADHFHDPVEQCYQMLLLWRSRTEEPTWAKLAEALHSVGCPHLAGGHQTMDSSVSWSDGAAEPPHAPPAAISASTQMSMKTLTCWNQFVTMSDSGEEVLTSEQGAGPAVSVRVAKLAQDIYDEFQNIIDQFGPDAVQSLAPLVMNVLKNLDNALGESEDNDRELVKLKEKYELLEQQYEKKRQRRTEAEETIEAMKEQHQIKFEELRELVELKEKYELLAQQYEKEEQRRREAEERYFQLEDANGIEIRQLKETVASMTAASQTATSKVQQQDEQISHLLDECDNMKKEAAELKQRHIDVSGSFESDKVPGYQDYVTPPGGGWAKRKLPVVRKQRIESSGQATLEPPPRETSPTYSEDYHLGRRLPDNKRSLAMEMRKKGQQQNEGSEVEEEYSDEYEDVDLLEPDQFGPEAVQSLVPLVENLNTALGESEDNGELVELKENCKLLTQQYETERQRWREDEETIKQHSETIEAELRKMNELNRCYFNRGLCLLLLGVGLGVGLALSPKLLYPRLAIPTPIPS